jgi:hypothetical protein
MTLNVKECDKMEGDSNFVPWKLRLQRHMEDIDLWEHVVKVVPKLVDLASLVIILRRRPTQR